MKIRVFPQEIATQIVLLLILSTVIFHLCISAAFLIGRNYSMQPSSAKDNGFVAHIADFVKMLSVEPKANRDLMLTWLAETDHRLDFKKQAPPQTQMSALSNDALIASIQKRAGPQIHVSRTAENNWPRIGFQFEDGAYLSVAIAPPMPSQKPEPSKSVSAVAAGSNPHAFPPPPELALSGLPPPPGPPLFSLGFRHPPFHCYQLHDFYSLGGTRSHAAFAQIRNDGRRVYR